MKRIATIGTVLIGCFAAAVFFAVHRSIADVATGAVDMRGVSEVSVVLTDRGWEPDKVLVSEGTTVTFSTTRPFPYWPASNEHPTHSLYPEFDPKEPIMASSTWSFTPKKGVWGFHDHVRSYYTGVLYVD